MNSQTINKLCVFCGSSSGTKPSYTQAAVALGKELAKENIGLVYGGGTVGLMGTIARTVHDIKGDAGVIGVIPESLTPKELSGSMIGELHVVQDMHQRKAKMAQFADGFIAMPGGFGTFEELLEVTTWQQLGFHEKPVALLNVEGFFDPLLAFFQHSINEGFIKPHHNNLIVSSDPAELIQKMREFKPSVSLLQSLAARESALGVDVSKSSMDAAH
eukprot:CAMPEP_0202893836 /NCGR_PEP_ID=MMETSP1392-20130828/3336_1 /ASSEMBLY_ACC=CAM_ASM_000868 /TAXON_ID=225041 /ORGANISM="Chlamydomonas chlamydogama, Strain SAG 11-48b" /LENGTH=215 /DNA_ID=CAMNT_0049578311 /DNA_START=122 /DNA_END=769 /DNA_ORIENTATION=-